LQGDYGKAPADVNAKLCAQAIGNEIVTEGCPTDLLNSEMDKLSKDIELDIINLNGYGRIEPISKTVLANT
jgi:pyruvate/oxaloacetate carboxyltransferase